MWGSGQGYKWRLLTHPHSHSFPTPFSVKGLVYMTWNPSPHGPKEEPCEGSENRLRAIWAEMQGFWIYRVWYKFRGPWYPECGLECGKWAPGGHWRRTRAGPSKAQNPRQGPQSPGCKSGKCWIGTTHVWVEERAVHMKATVCLEHGSDMFWFTVTRLILVAVSGWIRGWVGENEWVNYA